MRLIITVFLCIFSLVGYASTSQILQKTTRIPQFSNNEVNVWTTILYPNQNQKLPMHRHENNRIIIALDSGTLKITNDKQKSHYLKLKRNQAYYLTKDIPNELHSDENISEHIIRVMVIELKK